jgi:hypothetical protein
MVYRFLAPPRNLRWLAWGLILAGALLAAAAVALRDRSDRGDSPHNASYLLSTLGLLLVAAGAVLEARAGALLLQFAPGPARRRAVAEAILGIAASLLGCVAFGGIEAKGAGSLVRSLLAALLTGGVGAGLAGLFTLAWCYGLDWAAGRMERLDQPKVEETRRRDGDRA